MKNGMIGDGLYRFLHDNRGLMPALFQDAILSEQDKERLQKRLWRELNPEDPAAKLGTKDAEDLVLRIRRHGGMIDPYLQPALKRLAGIDQDKRYKLNGFIDDDAFRAIRAITASDVARVDLKTVSMDELYRFYGDWFSCLEATKNGLAEIEAEMARRA